jgi:hypothetical protein
MLWPVTFLVDDLLSQVVDFIDMITTTLKENKLRHCFLPIDVDTILEIAIYSIIQDSSGHDTIMGRVCSPCVMHIGC